MTGAEHYSEAERLLRESRRTERRNESGQRLREEALVHAQLATAYAAGALVTTVTDPRAVGRLIVAAAAELEEARKRRRAADAAHFGPGGAGYTGEYPFETRS